LKNARRKTNRKCKTEIVPKLNSVNINQNLKLKEKAPIYLLCDIYNIRLYMMLSIAWFSTSADVALRITIEGLDLSD